MKVHMWDGDNYILCTIYWLDHFNNSKLLNEFRTLNWNKVTCKNCLKKRGRNK